MVNSMQILLDIFLPSKCFACENDIKENYLCDFCCHLCNLVNNPLFLQESNVAALYFYEFSIKKIIHAAKYAKSISHVYVLLYLARQALINSELLESLNSFAFEAIAYVPSSKIGLWQRGFDIPYLFAQQISKLLNKPIIHILEKPFSFKKTSSLTNKKDRIKAIKDTFIIKKVTAYEKILLVDDVVTTQATFNECLRILKPYYKNIKCLAIAQTPLVTHNNF